MGAHPGERMRLHLGAGDKHWPGFWNGDLVQAAHHCDLRSLPFDDETVDEIHAIHAIEHVYPWQVVDILLEWKRALKPGGTVAIELPDRDKVFAIIAKGGVDQSNTLGALWGDPKHKSPDMMHKWCWNKTELFELFLACGFDNVSANLPYFHRPARDMRITAQKPGA
jgi:predicted SAM-dependent methyltransferase